MVVDPGAQARDEVLAEGLWERGGALAGLTAEAPT